MTFFNETRDLCTIKSSSPPLEFVEALFGRKTCKMEPGIYCKNNTKVMDIQNVKFFQIFGTGLIQFHEYLQHKEVKMIFNLLNFATNLELFNF